MTITIIGAGATSVAFLYNYLQLFASRNEQPAIVYLVEKRGVFGPGAAYASDSMSNLLNTKAGYISPFYDKPGDFYQWLKDNQELWRLYCPDLVLDVNGYVPRPLFGMYLQTTMSLLVKTAIAHDVEIVRVHAEAIDVTRVGDSYVTTTDCGLELTSEAVFFFCGTLPAKPPRYALTSNRVIPTPYPVSDLSHKIPCNARVAIVGARLSSIDAVIGLIENGHKAPITIHSRSGCFPSVRGAQGPLTPKLMTKSTIGAIVRAKGRLKLTDVVDLITREISLVSDKVIHPAFKLEAAPEVDLLTYLREEITHAKSSRAWQAVLYSTNAVIDTVWTALDEDDKNVFLNRYWSAYMCHRVSIPLDNAQKMLTYLQSGHVRFRAGEFSVALGADEALIITNKTDKANKPSVYDYVIYATGSPRSAHHLESTLIARLLRKGTMTCHKHGGIIVDPVTYQVVDSSGRPNPYCYAVGELTIGTFGFTSALEINARHARRCAEQFVESVVSPSTEPTTILV